MCLTFYFERLTLCNSLLLRVLKVRWILFNFHMWWKTWSVLWSLRNCYWRHFQASWVCTICSCFYATTGAWVTNGVWGGDTGVQVPPKFDLWKIWAKSLKIWTKSLKIWAKSLKIREKWRPTLFVLKKWRPTSPEKYEKNFFWRSHQKRISRSLWEKIFVGKTRTKTFRASLGKFGKKSFALPKTWLLLHICNLHNVSYLCFYQAVTKNIHSITM